MRGQAATQTASDHLCSDVRRQPDRQISVASCARAHARGALGGLAVWLSGQVKTRNRPPIGRRAVASWGHGGLHRLAARATIRYVPVARSLADRP